MLFDKILYCPYCKTKTSNRVNEFLTLNKADSNEDFSKQKFFIIKCFTCSKTYIMVDKFLPREKAKQELKPIDTTGMVGYMGSQSMIEKRTENVSAMHQIIFPVNTASQEIPAAAPSMPEKFQKLYDEAASVFDLSPRSSAALIRLTLESYLKFYLHKDNKKLYEMIKSFVKSNEAPKLVNEMMTLIRQEGNSNVHSKLDELEQKIGTIDSSTNREEILQMFEYMNILSKYISTLEEADRRFKKANKQKLK